VDVFDFEVAVVLLISDFHSSDEDIPIFSIVSLRLDGRNQIIEVFWGWYVEAGIPLTVGSVERDVCFCHGRLRSELLVS
jgi:hypothetical protein